jgi:NhaA family Na+:H+ antiporter
MRRIRRLRQRIVSPLRSFLKDSRATGIVLVACTAVSLLLSNMPATSAAYTQFWVKHLESPVPGLLLPHDWLHWINDGLMAVFFFLVGMEIKRELLAGELAGLRKSLLPVLAALGGMIFPALIFFLFNGGTAFHHGWGIPMATDIAFSLGIISLVGDRVPVQLKIFLTALAIIDDLGAVIVIAFFYAAGLHAGWLIGALAVMAVPLVLNLAGVRRPLFYFLPGAVAWYCLLHSGVHPTIAGVLLALCIPLEEIAVLEHGLYDPVNFLIMPLFALANTAIVFPASIGPVLDSPLTWGVVLGLLVGKPLGIFVFSFLSVKSGLAELPSNSSWRGLWGTGMIAGIGFTMSIFIATLAFGGEEVQVVAKIAILAGSVVAGTAGYLYLRYGKYAR